MPTIAILPEGVVARIAAGEILERPASLVRELVENALDAGARAIDVRVEEGGFALVRVEDDGCGMDAADARLALLRHATSKIRTVEDLGRIATLGYRGDALAAAAVSADVELLTSTGGAGTYLRAERGRIVEERPAGRSRGTTVTVYRIFARMPARRAALATPGREAAQCQRVAASYALAHPDVRLRFVRDGRLAFHTPGDGDLIHAVAALHPPGLVERLLPVAGSLRLPAGEAAVRGLVAAPGVTRRTRDQLLLAVNGRPVHHPALAEAVEAAYAPVLGPGRHPVCFLRLDLPPGEADPNVHPDKLAVRLAHESAVLGLVRGAVSRAIGESKGVERAVAASADRALEVGAPQALAKARWLGHWAGAYLVLADDDALYLVDQHAAAERALYEELARPARPHRLAEPAIVRFGALQLSLLDDLAPDLAALGFEVDPVGPDAVAVRAVPAAWADLPLAAALSDLISDLASSERIDPVASVASVACHHALRRGAPIDEAQARALVAALLRADNPHTCLHGRPAFLRLPLAAADRVFLRG